MKIKVSKNINYQKSGEEEVLYSVVPEKDAYQLALNAIVSWKNSSQLVEFAEKNIGYGNTDSMCGITYESNLDEYDREVDKVNIPVGHVQAYAEYRDVKEKNLTEIEYLTILHSYFEAKGEPEYADRIKQELEKKEKE